MAYYNVLINNMSDAKNQNYDIRVTETLSKIITVKAPSMELALSEAHGNYSDAKNGYVLDYSDLRGRLSEN